MQRRTSKALLLAALALAGCAHPHSPTGGEVTGVPFHVTETEPEAMSIVPDLSGPVVIRFDERISERNLAGAIAVSPETGEVEVKKRGRELRVSVEGGWQPGQIYRIVIEPVLQDLFDNKMEGAVEITFSTGPPIPATAVAGLVSDRLTREPVDGARVEAIRLADSVTYVAETDTAGLFALRHIPEGDYAVQAYIDRTPNRKPDFSEPIDHAELSLSASDTTIFTFSLLAPDTTPAVLMRAEATDSQAIQLSLDDHLDPEVPLDGVVARVWKLPDSTSAAAAEVDSMSIDIAEVLHLHEYEERVEEAEAKAAAEAAEADSVEVGETGITGDTIRTEAGEVADTSATDTTGTGAPTHEETEDEPGELSDPEAPDEPEPDEDPLPTRDLVVTLAEPLEPEAGYRITLEGVRNINGLEGGGGSVTFRAPLPPPEPEEGEEPEEDSGHDPDEDPDKDPGTASTGAGRSDGR